MATFRPWACRSRISAAFPAGVALATTSSTPASAAMVAAVSGLSPVTITVRTPIRDSCAKRGRSPGLRVSFRCTTPNTRPLRATTSGVPPARATRSTMALSSAGSASPA